MNRDKRVVRASELGQFEFCSMSHYLSSHGAKISGEGKSKLETGKIDHGIHGAVIDKKHSLNKALTVALLVLLGLIALVYYFQF